MTACCLPSAQAFGEAQKYLIVSSPRRSRIAYLRLPTSGAPATGHEPMRTLVDTGLKFPQGLAVDQYRKRLFVADPNLGFLAGYNILHERDALSLGKMWTAASNVEVRSVAVDGLGNVFFTDEPRQLIMRVTARNLDKGRITPEVVYDHSKVDQVSAPGGIAVDNYFVYWLNKANGEQAGTVVRAPQNRNISDDRNTGSGLYPVNLAANSMKCYGVCIALNHIYYTDERYNLYGIPRAATVRHNPVTISDALVEPRGCAFDGDSTVYIADKDQNAVFQFASNMPQLLTDRLLTKAVDLEGAFGVAVYVRVMD